MKLIVGLGNPGIEYEKTRHNAGFLLIDRLCAELNITTDKKKCQSLYAIYRHHDEKIIIAKPQTYMNRSGYAVKSLMKFYDVALEDLIVVHDDMDLPLGKLRYRKKGSSGGQKGMGSIIEQLGSSEIKRTRIGIAKDERIDAINYVLGRFSPADLQVLDESFDKGVEALIYSFDHDFELLMSRYN